jgi:hypothetical protein
VFKLAAALLAVAAGSSLDTANESGPRTACARDDPKACTSLGGVLAFAAGGRKDFARATELWEKACERGHAPACAFYGYMLLTGFEPTPLQRYRDDALANRSVRVDRPRARRILKRTCEGGHAPACTALATDDARNGDMSQSCTLFDRACNGGDELGCSERLRSCRSRVLVRGEGAKPSTRFAVQGLSADSAGVVLLERVNPPTALQRVGRLTTDGRWRSIQQIRGGNWSIASCGDGSLWVADSHRIISLTDSAAREFVLPRSVPLDRDWVNPSLDALVCLEDGSALVLRMVGGGISDDEVRAFLGRHPKVLTLPGSAVFQKLEFPIHPLHRPRELKDGRALLNRLAAELRQGRAWSEVEAEAKEGWYQPTAVEARYPRYFGPGSGSPPAAAFELAPGEVFGPIERLNPKHRGTHARFEGALSVWRLVSQTPEQSPAPADAVAVAMSRLRPRVSELLNVSRTGAISNHRRFTTMSSSAERERRIDPIVPLGGGDFLLLGDDRRIYRAGQWSSEAAVLGAFGPGRVRAAIRDGSRVLGLIEDNLVAVGLNGAPVSRVPLRHDDGREFYGTALGICGGSRFCVVAQDDNQLDVLVLDANLRRLHQDRLNIREAPFTFGAGTLWLSANSEGASILSYRNRQLTEYEVSPRETDSVPTSRTRERPVGGSRHQR